MTSNPEFNAFKHRIRELEAIIANSKERIEQRLDTLDQRHANLSEKERMSTDGLMLVMRMSELQWVLEGLRNSDADHLTAYGSLWCAMIANFHTMDPNVRKSANGL